MFSLVYLLLVMSIAVVQAKPAPFSVFPWKSNVESDNGILLCEYIQSILCARLEQVLNKQRDVNFSKLYRKGSDPIDGEFTISSFHGRSTQQEKTTHTQPAIHHILLPNTTYIFPSDITSLQITLPTHLLSNVTQTSPLFQDLSPPTRFQLCKRFLVLTFHFFPILSTAPLAYFSSWFRNKLWFFMLARSVSNCGPAFIKWGQWASTRSDMFPDSLCSALSYLHSNAPAHSWIITQKTVEQALSIPKGKLLSVFDSFEMQPIASGSIAQVHRATLRDTHSTTSPTLVAVKVRHPNVQLLIDMDFRIMSFLAGIIDSIPSLRWIQLRPSVEQFSHTMAAQAHLNVEAHHLEVLNYNFRQWDTVSFPKPLFASSSVIVETFERGKTCTSILDFYDQLATHYLSVPNAHDQELSSQGPSRGGDGHRVIPVPLAKFIVTTGVSIYLKMLLVDNLMHADLHPGNLMLDIFTCPVRIGKEKVNSESMTCNSLVPIGETGLHRNLFRSSATMGKLPKKLGEFYGHITLVDAGMVAQLDESESRNFVGLLVAIGEGDGRAAAEVVLGFSSTSCMNRSDDDKSDNRREMFIQDMITFFATSCRGYDTDLDFGLVLRGILKILKDHHVRIDANYATLVVNLMCVDGLARRVCPSYNCLDAAKPLLRSYKFLCQDNHGHLSPNNHSKWRQSILRYITPLMLARKSMSDRQFFQQLSLKRDVEASASQLHQRAFQNFLNNDPVHDLKGRTI